MSAAAAWPRRRDGADGAPVSLAWLDPELLDAVPAADRGLAERLAIATLRQLPAGAWVPDTATMAEDRHSLSVLVLKGVIVRDVLLAGRVSGHLFGPGDLLRPWSRTGTTLEPTSRWSCGADGAVVAELGDHFKRAACKWPGLSVVLHERLADQLEVATLRTAIVSMPRAEQRILALLWQLADQWGTATPDGVTVNLRLTHELIGRMVGARRPTVSLALQLLADAGQVIRTSTGHWRLAHGSHREIEPASGAGTVTPVLA